MIIELNINRLEQGVYEVQCVLQDELTRHNSISDALAYYGEDIPEELSQHVEIHYGGVSSGTTSIGRLRAEPQLIAQELVSLVAEVMTAEEEIALLQIKKRSIPNVKA